MLEQWEASQYILRRPFFEYFDPMDSKRRIIYNKHRRLLIYLDGTARIPINVAPELLNSRPAQRFANLARKLHKRIGFLVTSFPSQDEETKKDLLIPVHLSSIFEHNGFSVVGPWFPSLGHPVMTSDLPDAIKKSFVQESIFSMQESFDAVVIGFPTRKDGSGTDSLFTDPFLDGVAFSTVDCKDITFYLFKGRTEKDFDTLLDKEFFVTINSIEKCRKTNFEKYKKKSAKKKKNPDTYTHDVRYYLHHVFRKVLVAQ